VDYLYRDKVPSSLKEAIANLISRIIYKLRAIDNGAEILASLDFKRLRNIRQEMAVLFDTEKKRNNLYSSYLQTLIDLVIAEKMQSLQRGIKKKPKPEEALSLLDQGNLLFADTNVTEPEKPTETTKEKEDTKQIDEEPEDSEDDDDDEDEDEDILDSSILSPMLNIDDLDDEEQLKQALALSLMDNKEIPSESDIFVKIEPEKPQKSQQKKPESEKTQPQKPESEKSQPQKNRI
jgi:hypothetical protein